MLIFRENFTVEGFALPNFTAMEYSSYNLWFDRVCINLNIIYQQPDSSMLNFCEEFTTLLESNVMDPSHTIFTGDFNIQMDERDHLDTRLIDDVLDSFNFIKQCNLSYT